jgi:hypothetical protein
MPACYRMVRGRRFPRPTIPGPSCSGPACRLNTDNTHHPPKFLLSTLILILSRPGRRSGLRLRDKRSRSAPRFAPAESIGVCHTRRQIPHPYFCRHYYFMAIHCESQWPCTAAADAGSMNGGIPMLSTLPFAKRWVNKAHAARRIAERIASAFVPRGNLTPMTHEALCYACMVGIVMPTHRDITPWDPGHGNRTLELNDDAIATPERDNSGGKR